MTFVDEIGFERDPRKLGAADADVLLRSPLELPDSLEAEVPAGPLGVSAGERQTLSTLLSGSRLV